MSRAVSEMLMPAPASDACQPGCSARRCPVRRSCRWRVAAGRSRRHRHQVWPPAPCVLSVPARRWRWRPGVAPGWRVGSKIKSWRVSTGGCRGGTGRRLSGFGLLLLPFQKIGMASFELADIGIGFFLVHAGLFYPRGNAGKCRAVQRQRGQQRPSDWRVRHERKVHKDLLNYGRGDAGHGRLAASRLLKRPCRRQVQAQYGPGNQERGGLWPGAASALAKRAAFARGWVHEPKTGAAPTAAGVSATLWHAWQTSQEGQCPSLKALRHPPRARRSRASLALPIHGRNGLMRLCRGC